MTNPFKTYRIDHLFFRSFAGFIIVVLACTVWASFRTSSNELAQTTSYYQQQLLDELNNEITAQLVTIEQISLSTSRDNELINFLTGKQDQYERYQKSKNVEKALANLTYSIPVIQGIDLYMDQPLRGDSTSYIQFRDQSEASKELWFSALKMNDYAWSSEHDIPSIQGNVPVLSFVRKIVYDDKFYGTLVIHVKASGIRSMLAGHSSEANRVMLDNEGKQVLTTGQVPSGIQLSDWVDEAMQSGFAHIKGANSSTDSLLVYSKPQNSVWTLVEVSPWKLVTAGGSAWRR
ncbi:hypothetical protein [Paenibacillus hexagrammi]|uniref:hypothetical protein n=1 Tax=Paenibacillus hexagrammi TaxID=2908839 RepID=UPI002882EF7D|nr:hypothetical protein [Paenibacillus sp. YPD9-1]